ncbi:putative mitochondrial protein AtMg00860 [Nicotiana tabacum]|uniref:Mitochondrial protein AtMg00860 n=1 Tax=Nicotiana tabacum TaxID=4097 RepID=A0AC58S7Q2_TOBAC
MRKHQLFDKHNKYFFGVGRIKYLGHFITTEGVSIDSQKVKTVKKWILLTTIKQLRGFLGLARSYMRFIKGFRVINKLLTDLLKKDNFKWSHVVSTTFEQLKFALTEAPILALSNVIRLL